MPSRSWQSRSAEQLTLFPERLPFASALPFERPPAPAFVLQPPASYAEYLKSERWAELSAERIRIDGFQCRACPRTESLQVHHRRYPALLGTETVDDLTTFCSGCHVVIEWFRLRDRRSRMAAQRRK